MKVKKQIWKCKIHQGPSRTDTIILGEPIEVRTTDDIDNNNREGYAEITSPAIADDTKTKERVHTNNKNVTNVEYCIRSIKKSQSKALRVTKSTASSALRTKKISRRRKLLLL